MVKTNGGQTVTTTGTHIIVPDSVKMYNYILPIPKRLRKIPRDNPTVEHEAHNGFE